MIFANRAPLSSSALEFAVSALGGAAPKQFYALPGNSPTIKRAFTRARTSIKSLTGNNTR
jgi:hypothetical protein